MSWVSKFGWGALPLSIASLLPAQSVVINEYPAVSGYGIVAGPHGALWFTSGSLGSSYNRQ
jgi:hypothetical protein